MATTYEELYRKILLRLPQRDGEALLAAKEAVNTAQKNIARVHDFDELIVIDTTSADTVDGTKTYHLVDDWSLTRPKDILSLRYMDESNSRKLTYVSPRNLDEVLPYTETLGDRKPFWYTQRGNNVELIPTPDEAKDVYVMYTQWPSVLEADSDETDYVDIDDVIIELGASVAKAILSQEIRKWEPIAAAMLAGAHTEDAERPDRFYVAKPFNPYGTSYKGEYWANPFVKRNP